MVLLFRVASRTNRFLGSNGQTGNSDAAAPGALRLKCAEPWKRTQGNTEEQHTYLTLSRENVSQRLDWVTRSCSGGFVVLITRGGSLVRESRPPGSVPACSAMGIPTAIAFLRVGFIA
jgi:hypothetical protein